MKNFSAAALIAASLAYPATALAGPPVGIGGHPPLTVPGPPLNVPPVQLPSTPANTSHASVDGSLHSSTAAGANGARTSATTNASSTATLGRVTAFNGTTLTLTLPNGTTKTFTVSANAFGQNRPRLGERLAVSSDAQGNVISIAAADQSVRGTVEGVNKSAITLKLPNGRTVSVNVASQAAARMHLTPGSHVTLTTHDGGKTSIITKN